MPELLQSRNPNNIIQIIEAITDLRTRKLRANKIKSHSAKKMDTVDDLLIRSMAHKSTRKELMELGIKNWKQDKSVL